MHGADSSRPDRNWLLTSPRTCTVPPASPAASTRTGRWPGSPSGSIVGAQLRERVEQVAHRARPQRRRTVQHDGAVAQRRHREHEPRGRPGQPGVQDRAVDRWAPRRLPVTVTDGAPGPSRSPTPSSCRQRQHRLGVVGQQHAVEPRARPSASAAQTSARLVMLFDPGGRTDRVERSVDGHDLQLVGAVAQVGGTWLTARGPTRPDPARPAPSTSSSARSASTTRISRPPRSSGAVGHLDVVDVDRPLRGQRGDRRQLARAGPGSRRGPRPAARPAAHPVGSDRRAVWAARRWRSSPAASPTSTTDADLPEATR